MLVVLAIISIIFIVVMCKTSRKRLVTFPILVFLFCITSIFGMSLAIHDYNDYEDHLELVYAESVKVIDEAIQHYQASDYSESSELVVETLMSKRDEIQSEIDRFSTLSDYMPAYRLLTGYNLVSGGHTS